MAILALDHNHHDLSDLLNKHIKAFAKDEQKRIVAEAKAEEKRLDAEAKTEEKRLAAEEKRLNAEAKAEEKRLIAEAKVEEKRIDAEAKVEKKAAAERAQIAIKRAEMKGDQVEADRIRSKSKEDNMLATKAVADRVAAMKTTAVATAAQNALDRKAAATTAAQIAADKKAAAAKSGKKEIVVFDAGKSAAAHSGGGTATTIIVNLPAAFKALNTSFFTQLGFPPVVFSYQSDATGPGQGKALLFALANLLKAQGVDSFNGYQVPAGKQWEEVYYGKLAKCKVMVAMFSKSYFKSQACIDELKAALKAKKPVIPLFLEEVNMRGHFLGESEDEINSASLINMKVDGNCLPPPDQGFFQGTNADHFKRNAQMLIDTIKSKYLV